MFHGIPVIGIAGGIGSGKSYVSRLFADAGCLVIDSDAQVTAAYGLPEVRRTIAEWWGDGVIADGGGVDRRVIAKRVFNDPTARARLEQLLHPIVDRLRDQVMTAAAATPVGDRPLAFVWDTPLLFETGRYLGCDAVVFVDVPRDERLRRVQQTRGWDDAELTRREKTQWPLDNKRALSHYVLANAAGEAAPRFPRSAGLAWPIDASGTFAPAGPIRDQVQLTLSRILETNSGTGRE